MEKLCGLTKQSVLQQLQEVCVEMTLDADKTLNYNSMIHKLLIKHYPYRAFNARHNNLHVFVDKNNWNKLAPKLKKDVHLHKDGNKVVDLALDTTTGPHKFQLVAPNLSTRRGNS